MALPMDEQRILEEMERMLAADDPRLAARLSAFGQPGVSQVLRTRRAKAVLSLMLVAVIAAAASTATHAIPARLAASTPLTDRSAPFTNPNTARAECGVVKITPSACTAWSAAKP